MAQPRRYTHEPLAPRTSLGIGGTAEDLVEIYEEAQAVELLSDPRTQKRPLRILGGGTNLVVNERGVDGLVLAMANRGVQHQLQGRRIILQVAAGEPWDDVVAACVADDLAGLECLSGIPGLTGATPIQNVGAYGQQVSDTLVAVRAYDRQARRVIELAAADCQFGYRDSVFKRQLRPRYVVLGCTFSLHRGPPSPPVYEELRRRLSASARSPTLAAVRQNVLDLRRAKSMLIDSRDPNSRSVGSFFLNPLLDPEDHAASEARARQSGALAATEAIPAFAADRRVKVPAAWLIERAGFARGYGEGSVGLSDNHTLAIVTRGGATGMDVLALATRIRSAVEKIFGITLRPEPVFWGFDQLPW